MMNESRGNRDDVVHQEEEPPLKRVRLSYSGGLEGQPASCEPSQLITQQPRFLSLHLDFLRSLYSAGEKENDDIFSLSQDFLNHRWELLKGKQEASRWKGIHKEALDWSKTSSEDSSRRNSFSNSTSTTPFGACRPFHLSQRRIGASPESPEKSQGSSFSLISRLLGQRAEKAGRVSQQQAASYHALLDSVQSKLQQLQDEQTLLSVSLDEASRHLLDQLLSSNPSVRKEEEDNNKSMPSQLERSRAAATVCKLRLWTMLALDLKQVLQDD